MKWEIGRKVLDGHWLRQENEAEDITKYSVSQVHMDFLMVMVYKVCEHLPRFPHPV